jgi:hypothetical protein
MTEVKVCWQTYLQEPTPCFKMAGNRSCSPKDCLVEQAADKIPFMYQDLILRLCHSICRISAVSENNQEFLERMAENEKKHLLNIKE